MPDPTPNTEFHTDLSFETALERLESIVRQLETGQASLEGSIDLYEEGVRLKQLCEARLKSAQMRIDRLTLGPEGTPSSAVPFED
jgi:exodeoxyribonuclease VII small subunit